MMISRSALVLCAAVLCAPSASHAQFPSNIKAPIQAAEKARAKTDSNLSAQTGQAVTERKAWEAKGAQTTAPAPQKSGPPPKQSVAGKAGAQPKSGPGAAPAGPAPAPLPAGFEPVTREVYLYQAEGRRDPFFSLILTEDLRPLLSDLRLTGILYDPSGKHSVALMRDLVTNAQYRVTTGMTLGRMHVAQIKPRSIMFTIDEFGLNRTDSLFLADTNKTRIR